MKIQVSLSAVKLSDARPYVKGWDKGRYADVFRKFSTNDRAYRVYIPLDHVANIPIPAPGKIAKLVEEAGYTIEDYRAGIAVDKSGKRRMRIGRLISSDADAKKMFDNDKRRTGFRAKYMICISRHPYDIIGASTDRGWSSCINLIDGSNKKYLKEDVQHGTIIAYLIEEHDRNINNPAGRILIKPYVSKTHKVLACDAVYGANVQGFVLSVQRWLDKNFNAGAPVGEYALNKHLYRDTRFKHFHMGDFDDKAIEMLNDEDEEFRTDIIRAYPEALRHLKNLRAGDLMAALRSSLHPAYEILLEKNKPAPGSKSKKPQMDVFDTNRVSQAILRYYPEMVETLLDKNLLKLTDDRLQDILEESNTPDILRYVPEKFLTPANIMVFPEYNDDREDVYKTTYECLPQSHRTPEFLEKLIKVAPGFIEATEYPTDKQIMSYLKSVSVNDYYWRPLKFDRMDQERRESILKANKYRGINVIFSSYPRMLNDVAMVKLVLDYAKTSKEMNRYQARDSILSEMTTSIWRSYTPDMQQMIIDGLAAHQAVTLLSDHDTLERLAEHLENNLDGLFDLPRFKMRELFTQRPSIVDKLITINKVAKFRAMAGSLSMANILGDLMAADAKIMAKVYAAWIKNIPGQITRLPHMVARSAAVQKATLVNMPKFIKLIDPDELVKSTISKLLEIDLKTVPEKERQAVAFYISEVKELELAKTEKK